MAIGLQSTLWLERLTTPFTTNVRKCIHLKYEIQTLPTALIDVLEDNQHYFYHSQQPFRPVTQKPFSTHISRTMLSYLRQIG